MRALIGTLSGMTSDMTLQLAELDTCIIALWAFVRLLVRVLVSDMTNQLTRSCESRFTELAQMRFGSGVSINVICQACNCFESALADTAFVRSRMKQINIYEEEGLVKVH